MPQPDESFRSSAFRRLKRLRRNTPTGVGPSLPWPARPRACHQLPVGDGGRNYQPLSRKLPQRRVTGTTLPGVLGQENFPRGAREEPFRYEPAVEPASRDGRGGRSPVFSGVDAKVGARVWEGRAPGHIRDVGSCRRDGPHGRPPSENQGVRHRFPVPEPFTRRSTRHVEES